MTRPWEIGFALAEDRAKRTSRRRRELTRVRADARTARCPTCRAHRHAPCVTNGTGVPTKTHIPRVTRWKQIVLRVRCGACGGDSVNSDIHIRGSMVLLRECPTRDQRGHIHWICLRCAAELFFSGAYDRRLSICPISKRGQAQLAMLALGGLK